MLQLSCRTALGVVFVIAGALTGLPSHARAQDQVSTMPGIGQQEVCLADTGGKTKVGLAFEAALDRSKARPDLVLSINAMLKDLGGNEKIDARVREALNGFRADRNGYIVLHLVQWNAAGRGIEAERWALYRGGETGWSLNALAGRRIFGSERVAVLTMHASRVPEAAINYKAIITKKTPTPFQSLKDAIQLFEPVKALVAVRHDVCGTADNAVGWNFRALGIEHVPSNLKVHLLFTAPPAKDARGGIGERVAAEAEPKDLSSDTFLNEGRYHWDISVGVPVTKVSELTYNADDGIVRTRKIDRQKAFAFMDIYPRAVDLNENKFRVTPLKLGVSLDEKPFDHTAIAAGVGFSVLSAFAGIALNRGTEPETLAEGQPASNAQLDENRKSKLETDFIFGVTVSVTQAIKLLKGNTKASTKAEAEDKKPEADSKPK